MEPCCKEFCWLRSAALRFWLGTATCLMIAAAGCAPARVAEAPVGEGKFSVYDTQVNALLGQMTLAEKVGQMTQADHEFLVDPTDVETYFLGSVLNGGSSDPKEGNSREAWTAMYNRYQQRALATRLGIPLLHGVDAVHGHNNVVGAVIFPHNIGLGCTRDAELVERISHITALEMKATGIHWTFAPAVTVPQDIRWGRTYEGFSEDPALVTTLGKAAVRGLQGDSLSNPLSVLACAKHFVGDGGTAMGTGVGGKGLDQGDVRVDEATLRRIHMPGYIDAIAAGVGSIMPSYSSWNGEKCSGSKRLLTEILKGELGFEGFLISDYNAIDQLDPDFKKAVEKSINAGMDMAMAPTRYGEFHQTLMALVEEGAVPMERIDDAVRRILRVKAAMGLLDKARSPLADPSHVAGFGSAEYRAVARRAVAQSLVLLKNQNGTLPASKNANRIHISGKNADDIGNQCGGWTIDWQGKSGEVTTGGTTILAAIRKAVSPETTVTFSADGAGAAGADLAILVIGETPYAEMQGDRESLTLSMEDLKAFGNAKQAGVPLVVVLVSGRPMVLDGVINQADALIAAWLPGTEGDGVADILFGDAKPSGKLSFSWPRSDSQVPVTMHSTEGEPLFRFGFGMTYE